MPGRPGPDTSTDSGINDKNPREAKGDIDATDLKAAATAGPITERFYLPLDPNSWPLPSRLPRRSRRECRSRDPAAPSYQDLPQASREDSDIEAFSQSSMTLPPPPGTVRSEGDRSSEALERLPAKIFDQTSTSLDWTEAQTNYAEKEAPRPELATSSSPSERHAQSSEPNHGPLRATTEIPLLAVELRNQKSMISPGPYTLHMASEKPIPAGVSCPSPNPDPRQAESNERNQAHSSQESAETFEPGPFQNSVPPLSLNHIYQPSLGAQPDTFNHRAQISTPPTPSRAPIWTGQTGPGIPSDLTAEPALHHAQSAPNMQDRSNNLASLKRNFSQGFNHHRLAPPPFLSAPFQGPQGNHDSWPQPQFCRPREVLRQDYWQGAGMEQDAVLLKHPATFSHQLPNSFDKAFPPMHPFPIPSMLPTQSHARENDMLYGMAHGPHQGGNNTEYSQTSLINQYANTVPTTHGSSYTDLQSDANDYTSDANDLGAGATYANSTSIPQMARYYIPYLIF